MMRFTFPWFLLACLAPLALHAVQPSLLKFEARVPLLRQQIPALIKSAEKSAENSLQHPKAAITMPRRIQEPFAAELLSRAGGLGGAWYADKSREIANEPDTVLLSIRSWETHAELLMPLLTDYKARGWTTVVFASAAGKPDNMAADFFIDNGAPSPAKEYGYINTLANTTLGWMWVCEYAAAMSRKGQFPGILYSVAMPGAKDHNKTLQGAEHRGAYSACPMAIPGGELAEIYLKRTEKMIGDLKSTHIQGQLTQAASIIAERMNAGRTVGITGTGHYILDEVRETDMQAPWKQFRSTGKTNPFSTNLKPGELLVFFTYLGMKSAYYDFLPSIQEAGVDLITSYAVDPIWSKDPPTTLAHIDQSWQLPDAEVPIPVFPNLMAPVSGINTGLLLRMLDDEVARRLVRK